MAQTFFTDTLEGKFVKALLRNTPLPIYPSVSQGDYLINGLLYIYKDNIIKCMKTGILSNNFRTIAPYRFGEFNCQFTEKYVSKYNYYDSETHEYLGNYLRLYRDTYDIDLMPFYNCFSYKFVDDVSLVKGTDNPKGYILSKNNAFKVAAIPIKFDKTYTIAIDSTSEVLLKSFLYGQIGLLEKTMPNGDTYYATEDLNDCDVDYKVSYTSNCGSTTNYSPIYLQTSSFKNLITYRINLNTSSINDPLKARLKSLEKYLYLFVRLQRDNTSSIVVLEGDYSNEQTGDVIYNLENVNKAINNIVDSGKFKNGEFLRSNLDSQTSSVNGFDIAVQLLNKMSANNLNRALLSDLSLLQINTHSTYAFSDRLIEYLLLNVIDSNDSITTNIISAQKLLDISNREDSPIGEWSTALRYRLFKNYMRKENVSKLDINGFIDKDMEKNIVKI